MHLPGLERVPGKPCTGEDGRGRRYGCGARHLGESGLCLRRAHDASTPGAGLCEDNFSIIDAVHFGEKYSINMVYNYSM